MFFQLIAGTMIALLVAGLFALSQSAYIVDERTQVIVTQFGEFVRSDREPGLYFKVPIYQATTSFDKRILANDTPPAEYLTLDKKQVVVDTITRWRISDPLVFFVTVHDESGARARLDDIVLSATREEVAQRNFVDVIATHRETIEESVTARAAERGRQFGIEVVEVRNKRTDLPVAVQNSVFARMVAERARIASRYRSEGEEEAAKIRAEADKTRTIMLAEAYEASQRLRGDGDAEATAIYAAAYGQDPEFYSFLRSLEAYEKSLGTGTTIVLSSESELLRFFAGHRAVEATQAGTQP